MYQFLLVVKEFAIPVPYSGCLLTHEGFPGDNVSSDVRSDLLTPHADVKLMKFS